MDITRRLIKKEKDMNIENYITLKEWAEQHGIHPDTARQRALRGAFQTAKKIGNLWIISKDEPHIDHRKKGEGN
jgi:hypothetical protein